MRKLFKSDRGSVSVYLIIIILPVFIFHAVLIDFARIKIAERQSELASQAAVRSILSTFDKDLLDYGLYGTGLDQATADTVFKEILEGNLSVTERPNTIYDDIGETIDDIEEILDGNLPTEDKSYLKLLRPELKESSVTLNKESYSLANQPNIFHRQVLEEMKYKAPIEVTISLIEKFGKGGEVADLQNEVEGAEKQVENAKEFQEKVEERDKAIADLKSFIDNIKTSGSFKNMVDPANKNLCQSADTCNHIDPLKTIYDISNQGSYIHYDAIEDEAVITAFKSTGTQIIDDVYNQTGNIPKNTQELEGKIREIITLDGQVESLLNEMNNGAESQHRLDPNQYVYKAQLRKMESASKAANKNITDIRDNLAKIKGHISSNSYTQLPGRVTSVNNSFLAYQKNLQTITTEKTSIDGKIGNRKQFEDVEANNAADEQLKKQGKEKISLDQVGKILEDIKNGSGGVANDYKEVETFFNQYFTANDPNNQKPKEPGDYEEDDEDSALAILDLLSNILGALRDEIYLNEFALSKFNYHTWEEDDAYELSFNLPHKIEKEEVEYIIYGFHQPYLNYAAAFGEIYLIRTALRFIEGLKLIKGPPPVIIIGALIYGAAMAFYDTLSIVNGADDVNFIPDQLIPNKIPFIYKDYLRLFLLLHSNNERMMARTQALIHHNTSKNLQEHMSYIEGKYQTSLRLWFVPGIMKALNITGALDGRVEGQYYLFPEKVTASSY